MSCLTLDRKQGQKVMICVPGRTDPIVLLVSRIENSRVDADSNCVSEALVGLTFNADRDIRIDREEVFRARLRKLASSTAEGAELN